MYVRSYVCMCIGIYIYIYVDMCVSIHTRVSEFLGRASGTSKRALVGPRSQQESTAAAAAEGDQA